MIAGITGGIGCGKSTVGRALERRGFRRLDSDQIVKERVLTDPEVIAVIRGKFGEAVVNLGPDGRSVIVRHALAEQIFKDDAARLWLEELTHPRVAAIRQAEIAAHPGARWAVEIPLLFEKGLANWVDFTVCVACAPAQQLARLEQRGLPRGLAGQRISKQLPLARKIERSDFVLWNEGSPEFLHAEVNRLADALTAAGNRLPSRA